MEIFKLSRYSSSVNVFMFVTIGLVKLERYDCKSFVSAFIWINKIDKSVRSVKSTVYLSI